MPSNDYKLAAVFAGVDKLTRPIGRMQSKLASFSRKAERNLSGLNRQLDKLGGGVKRVGVGLAALAVPVGLVGASVISTGAGFEQAISRVGAVSLKTREEIADLEAKAKQLGATTKFTATESAQAMEIMARAGFTNQEILSGVDGVLAAAAASGLEMSEVANHVSNSLKGMGLKASEAGRVADVLTLASARTNSTIGSLGESMTKVAPVARQFGIGFEESVAAVALLQDVGIDASEAGTATATMLTKLAKPSAEVAKQMRDLGISFEDSEGNFVGFSKTLEQFDEAAKKSGGDMKVVSFFADLVGLRGQKAALNLKDLFATGKVSELTNELDHAAGTAEKMAKLNMDNTIGSWDLFKSAVDGVKTELFQTQDGALKGLIDDATEWVNRRSPDFIKSLEDIGTTISNNRDDIKKWAEKTARFTGALAAVALGVKAVTVATWLWNAAMAANPIGLIITGVALLASLIFAFWPEILAWGRRVDAEWAYWWANVKEGAQEMVDGVVADIDRLKGKFVDAWNTVRDAAYAAAGWVIHKWDAVWSFASELWGDIGVMASDAYADLTGAWDGLVSYFDDLWQGIADGFGELVSPIISKVEGLANLANEALSFATGNVQLATAGGGVYTPSSGGGGPQVISQAEQISRTLRSESVSESRQSLDINVNDPHNRVSLPGKRKLGAGITVRRTGAPHG